MMRTNNKLPVFLTVVITVLLLLLLKDKYGFIQMPGNIRQFDKMTQIEINIKKNTSVSDSNTRTWPLAIQDLENNMQNHFNLLPSHSEAEKMNHSQLAAIYHTYINNIELNCRKKLLMGNLVDGGYEICDDKEFRPQHHCLVYSFGIRNDFSFDDAVSKQYSCDIHCFDPSMKMKDGTKHKPNITFHKKGLANFNGTSNSWKMRTLKKIKEELNHSQKTLDILKVDIEDWEWKALPEMISSGAMASVRQFAVEFHMLKNMKRGPDDPDRNRYLHSVKTLKSLQELGFRVLWTEKFKPCQYFSKLLKKVNVKCHNVLFGNLRLMNKDRYSALTLEK